MASDSEESGSENLNSNYQDRSHLKRKVSMGTKYNDFVDNPGSNSDSNDGVVFPEVLVKVEVCEVDEPIPPGGFEANIPFEKKSTKPRKKKSVESPSDLSESSKKRVVSCKVCDAKFTNRSNMYRHKKIHTGSHKCPICNIMFKSNIYLNRHLSSHEPTQKCDMCDEKFQTELQLAKHKSKHTEQDDEMSKWPNPEPFKVTKFFSRDELSHEIQNAIVSKMIKGRAVSDICQLYAVTPDIVNEIWNDRDKFVLPKQKSRRSTKYMNSILEPLVYEWYNAQKERGVQVTGKMFQHIAENLARENGLVHFDAGSKWLEQFKKRYNIYLNSRKRDYSSWPSESVWKTKFFKETWSDLRLKYTDDEIYTADEVGLFYNPSKSREKKLNGKKYIHGCPQDRMSIFLCVNMPGTDKKKLLICGTEDPLRRSSRDPSTLPVEYRRHTKCHFTTNMFEDFITKWNEDLQKTYKKALLILDRASIHSKLEMSHLKLVFIPWKAANSLMPIKSGIYPRFRSEFRDLLLEFKVSNVLKGVDRHLTCLESLEMLAKAWDRMPKDVITKSFVDIGYGTQTTHVPDVEQNSENHAEFLCEILKDYDVEQYFTDVFMLDMYLTVDEDLLTGQGTNPTLFGGNHKAIEPVANSNEELPLNTEIPLLEKESFIKKTQALSDLEVIRKYLQASITTNDVFSNFLDVEKSVMDNFVKLNH